jgi:hypothetical protein
MKGALKTDACIICGRKVQPTEHWMRCHLWGGFASFHWRCSGEYLRADSEQQVETVVWKAISNRDPSKQTDETLQRPFRRPFHEAR